MNDLIRKAREKNWKIEFIRATLIASEKPVQERGWVTEAPEEIIVGFNRESPP